MLKISFDKKLYSEPKCKEVYAKKVYSGYWKSAKDSGKKVACVRNLNLWNGSVEGFLKIYDGEINVWKELDHHQNLVEFYGACCWDLGHEDVHLFAGYTVIFVMERMEMTLRDYMKLHTKPTKKLVMSILCQVARPIKFLSDQGIENKCMETYNFLVQKDNDRDDIVLKLGYFGLIRKQDPFNCTKEDVYRLGCILMDLLKWGGLESEKEIMDKLVEMKNIDPVKRPDISEILVLLEKELKTCDLIESLFDLDMGKKLEDKPCG
jgi:serine/threonine protein kinase